LLQEHPEGHKRLSAVLLACNALVPAGVYILFRVLLQVYNQKVTSGESRKQHQLIITLVERHTRYLMLVKVPSKDTETVINALIKRAHKLPSELYKSLTRDRGKEMTDHKRFTLASDIKVYFCDPQSPWQRGSNENTNGLLRQYFPKGTDLSVHSQAKLNAVARQLDERPRKTLSFETPAERFNACVASIG
jgi:IS30 family transposase